MKDELVEVMQADPYTDLTFDELMERLPSDERLVQVAEHLERLERICTVSPGCMTPEGSANKAIVYAFMQSSINDAAFAALALRQLRHRIAALREAAEWPLGTRVEKIKGSSWRGHVVGYYSTSLTPEGYCVESEREPGSVQIYPRAALKEQPK